LRYAREHLTRVWSQGGTDASGYACPDSGQLWIMDYPENGTQHGPVRLRVVSDAEWQESEPTDLVQLRPDVRKGQRWQMVSELHTSGLTSRAAPFTGGFECVSPRGTVVRVQSDPPIGARAVGCTPENYEEIERLVVPEEDRTDPQYGGYSLVIDLTNFGETLVAAE
jgi:hypothetical protein